MNEAPAFLRKAFDEARDFTEDELRSVKLMEPRWIRCKIGASWFIWLKSWGVKVVAKIMICFWNMIELFNIVCISMLYWYVNICFYWFTLIYIYSSVFIYFNIYWNTSRIGSSVSGTKHVFFKLDAEEQNGNGWYSLKLWTILYLVSSCRFEADYQ